MRKLKELGIEDMDGPNNYDMGETEHPVMPQPGEMEAMEHL